MATLFGRSPKDSYQELLKLNSSTGSGNSLATVEDGAGNATPLQLSKTQIALNGAFWPTSLGTAGQVLSTDASGNLSWATVSAGASGGLKYTGTWDASTNTPAFASSTGTTGAMYKVSAASTTFTRNLQNAQSGNLNSYFMTSVTSVKVGQAFFYGSTFLGYVASINGNTVYSDRYVNANTSGALTFYTGYLDGITSFNVGDYVFFDGTVWEKIAAPTAPTSSQITTALGYTPVNAAAPSITAALNIATAGSNYNDGIRLQRSSANSYSSIAMAADSSGAGSIAGQFNLLVYPTATSGGAFTIRANATDSLTISTAGVVSVSADPTTSLGVATKQYVDSKVSTVAASATSKYSGNFTITSASTVSAGSMNTCTSAGFNMTLPSAAAQTSGVITTILNSATSGVITVVMTGSDKLSGLFPATVTSMTLNPGESATFAALPSAAQWDVINYTRTTNPTFTGRLQSDAYSYTVKALGSISGAQTLDLSTGSLWTATIAADTTFAFTNTLAANVGQVVFLRLTNAGSFTIYWPANTKFASGTAPTFSTGVDMLGVMYDTTTSTYMVFVIGTNIATPSA